jgi:hypothetical protein
MEFLNSSVPIHSQLFFQIPNGFFKGVPNSTSLIPYLNLTPKPRLCTSPIHEMGCLPSLISFGCKMTTNFQKIAHLIAFGCLCYGYLMGTWWEHQNAWKISTPSLPKNEMCRGLLKALGEQTQVHAYHCKNPKFSLVTSKHYKYPIFILIKVFEFNFNIS